MPVVNASSPRRQPGIKVHRSVTLRPEDVTLVENIPCTTIARTQLDLADVVHRRGRLFYYYEYARADGSHELRVSIVPLEGEI